MAQESDEDHIPHSEETLRRDNQLATGQRWNNQRSLFHVHFSDRLIRVTLFTEDLNSLNESDLDIADDNGDNDLVCVPLTHSSRTVLISSLSLSLSAQSDDELGAPLDRRTVLTSKPAAAIRQPIHDDDDDDLGLDDDEGGGGGDASDDF